MHAGVGKTSTARIFAKALNCTGRPHSPPGQRFATSACSIDAGEDVDVLEIDGASNRGIDEIRQLRCNVNIRPSRARFKIYIIDEVHMLTTPAFNALLKTLEEPPEHVKFIFCTTDPQKIPITVLSRCQRFDFAPVNADEIVGRLKHIVEMEGRAASDEAWRCSPGVRRVRCGTANLCWNNCSPTAAVRSKSTMCTTCWARHNPVVWSSWSVSWRIATRLRH